MGRAGSCMKIKQRRKGNGNGGGMGDEWEEERGKGVAGVGIGEVGGGCCDVRIQIWLPARVFNPRTHTHAHT